MSARQATLCKKENLAPGIFSLWLEAHGLGNVDAGQFFEFATQATFLRRAFSVADREQDLLLFVVRVVGPGTGWLSQLSPGSNIDVIGPLGQGVSIPETGPVMLLAGGVGAAPLLYLARNLYDAGIETDALLAARTKQQIILSREFESLCRRVILATDDGTCGVKGCLTDVVGSLDQVRNAKAFYACGPEPMYAALDNIGLKPPVYAFLESRMGCGSGLCMGCAVRGKNGSYLRVCTQGPVFNLAEIDL